MGHSFQPVGAEIVIIGGGPAGAGLAIELSRAGRDVLLIEREAGPHDKVCGEFLSHEALVSLDALGIDAEALGAVPISKLSLAAGEREVNITLPFPARSLSRRVLDEALLAHAAAEGTRLLRGEAVVETRQEGDGWRLRLRDGTQVAAAKLVLATGKHDLRGAGRPPGKQADLIGFKMYFRLGTVQAAAIDQHIVLALFDGGYAGLQPVEDDRANLCLVVRRSRFAELGHDWVRLLVAISHEVPSFGERLAEAEAAWRRPLAIAGIPYGFVAQPDEAETWRLGDQAAVIPSFSGDGMSIALHSARRAASGLLQGGTPSSYIERLRRDVGSQVSRATVVSRLFLNPHAQNLLLATAGLAPSLLSVAAHATRVPKRARMAALAGA
jgi:flavin-dependent dehydrogenase